MPKISNFYQRLIDLKTTIQKDLKANQEITNSNIINPNNIKNAFVTTLFFTLLAGLIYYREDMYKEMERDPTFGPDIATLPSVYIFSILCKLELENRNPVSTLTIVDEIELFLFEMNSHGEFLDLNINTSIKDFLHAINMRIVNIYATQTFSILSMPSRSNPHEINCDFFGFNEPVPTYRDAQLYYANFGEMMERHGIFCSQNAFPEYLVEYQSKGNGFIITDADKSFLITKEPMTLRELVDKSKELPLDISNMRSFFNIVQDSADLADNLNVDISRYDLEQLCVLSVILTKHVETREPNAINRMWMMSFNNHQHHQSDQHFYAIKEINKELKSVIKSDDWNGLTSIANKVASLNIDMHKDARNIRMIALQLIQRAQVLEIRKPTLAL